LLGPPDGGLQIAEKFQLDVCGQQFGLHAACTVN
jgi:hypothetical protein